MEIIERPPIELNVNGWCFYCKMTDDHVASVCLDLGIREQVSTQHFPIVTKLSIPLLHPFNGLAMGDEAKRLDEMEEAVEAAVNRPPWFMQLLDARKAKNCLFYVGRVTHAGVREYYFYSIHEIDLDFFKGMQKKFVDHPFGVRSATDKDWQIYTSDLHPGPALAPLLLSWAQLELRTKNGDDLTLPHDVDHTLFFKYKKRRDDFLEYIKDEGWKARKFDASSIEAGRAGKSFQFGVNLTKSHRIDRMWSDIYIVGLSSRAEKFGGMYGGWGAFQILKKKSDV